MENRHHVHIKWIYCCGCRTVSWKIMAMLIPNLKSETLLEAWKQLFLQVDNIQAIIYNRETKNTLFRSL